LKLSIAKDRGYRNKFQVDLEGKISEQAALMWKIGAMQKPIELRLKEKDSVISQLNKELQVFILDSKLRFILEF
jgi:hypothetical protein